MKSSPMNTERDELEQSVKELVRDAAYIVSRIDEFHLWLKLSKAKSNEAHQETAPPPTTTL